MLVAEWTWATVLQERRHSASDYLQLALVMILLPIIMYALAGRLMAAQSPGGKLTWTGRRWQRGAGGAAALWCAGLLIYMFGRSMPMAITVPLWALLGYIMILGVRWLWRDWKKEVYTRDVELQKLAQEGKTYSPPRDTGANKMWRWLLNGYAIALIVALVYALIRYLVSPK